MDGMGHFNIVVLSQIMQAFAIKSAVEIHRRSKPFCMGTLYWQFNDCWPAISWSSVDYFGNWKVMKFSAKSLIVVGIGLTLSSKFVKIAFTVESKK